jgi:hypothetical protein
LRGLKTSASLRFELFTEPRFFDELYALVQNKGSFLNLQKLSIARFELFAEAKFFNPL